MISIARAKFALFTFWQPPQGQIMSRMRLINGRSINRKIPIYPPVVIGSYLLPGGSGAFGSPAGATYPG